MDQKKAILEGISQVAWLGHSSARGTVVALATSHSIIAAQGGTLEAIRREGGVLFIRIELPRFNSP